ncbi:Uncharacterized protein OBRU01_03959 [Operophtera brumata]|uniref:Uncharacterized protein n=1 Tax=Operophtera brumata TaxID=104452 RepID=A0A0L7LCI4_OPEBR|nr:Uncharacterized protein OBRU01_03959 [Operophtera brumata]
MMTLWVLLTDIASFKSTFLPDDNAADFSYFFDTSRRRLCYVAPERFVRAPDPNNRTAVRETCSNIMVTLWVLLTDIASFKPAFLPDDNPADFSYFFDTSRRRLCYVAPERFVRAPDPNNRTAVRETCSNILMTSWLWVLLTDIASFLPDDNPADFSYFFDTSRRRLCYVAPERFVRAPDPNNRTAVRVPCSNIMVTLWVLLTDIASFKPTFLPDDNPADFSYFFDTSRRRLCYVAPER